MLPAWPSLFLPSCVKSNMFSSYANALTGPAYSILHLASDQIQREGIAKFILQHDPWDIKSVGIIKKWSIGPKNNPKMRFCAFFGPRIWHQIFGGKPESDVLPLHPLPNEANAGARLCVMASERGRPGDDTVNWLLRACGAFQIHSQE